MKINCYLLAIPFPGSFHPANDVILNIKHNFHGFILQEFAGEFALSINQRKDTDDLLTRK